MGKLNDSQFSVTVRKLLFLGGQVAIPLLISLSYLHKLDLIHRDIKLENIFVDANNRVKFGDLGLTMSTREERGISPVGTVEYMAPEVF